MCREPKDESMQQEARPRDGKSPHLDAPFELMDLVFLKQVYSFLEMFVKKAESCLSVI